MEKLKIISLVEEFSEIVGESDSLKDLKNVSSVLSQSNPKILILGENGSGKNIIASNIHQMSSRKYFFKINCFLLSQKGKFNLDTLIFEENSTLFFENFHFLDNEQKETVFEFIKKQSEATGIIFSSVANFDNPFLSLITLNIPPLRNRKEDIFPLCVSFIQNYSLKYNKIISGVSSDLKKKLEEHEWKGNVDELKSVIEKACIICEGKTLEYADLNFDFYSKMPYTENEIYDKIKNTVLEDKTLKTAVNNFKRIYVKKILEEENWNQTKASKTLDIQRTYLSRLLSELNIER